MVINSGNITMPLWNGKIPNYKEKGESNIVEIVDGNPTYTLLVKPEIEVYLASEPDLAKQAVLVIPGGAYLGVSYVLEGYDIAKWLNSFGITAIVLKYRLPHAKSSIVGHKSPLLDASRAMKIIRANAAKWNICENNIGVMGFSAGGHLASTIGTHFNIEVDEAIDEIDSVNDRPDFMVLGYPVITMSESFTHKGSMYNLLGQKPIEELKYFYSNEKHINNHTPPTFLVHSSDDKVVDVENSISFYKNLLKNDVDAELHIFKKGGHAFALANEPGKPKMWKDLCIDWLKNLGFGKKG